MRSVCHVSKEVCRVCRSARILVVEVAPHAGFLAALGLRPAEHPAGVGEYIPSDATGRTDVPGVWVAGNVADPVAQVGAAAAAGTAAAAQINADLVAEETREAVAGYRDAHPALSQGAPA